MLGKLLKHDFRATARIILPVYAAVPVLGLFTNLITRLCENQNGFLIRAIGALVSFVFSLSLIAAVVTTVVLMILRFYVVEPKPALQLNLRIWKILRFSMIW